MLLRSALNFIRILAFNAALLLSTAACSESGGGSLKDAVAAGDLAAVRSLVEGGASVADGGRAGFPFKAGPKPVRFVWEMDGGNTFVSVSDELAKAVGPKSANVAGLSWEDVGETSGLVNAGEISALLEKGDTWSGKTVLWPVQGTDLRVPIDMAGLPLFRPQPRV